MRAYKANNFIIFMIILSTTIGFLLAFIPQIDFSLYIPITQIIVVAVPIFLFLKLENQSLKQIIPFKKVSIKSVILTIALTIAIQPASSLISSISSLFFKNNVAGLMIDTREIPFVFMIISIAVLPAIFEELAFRGVVLSYYENVPANLSIFLNGFLFGIFHFNLQQFLYAFAIGALFAYLVKITGSIYISIISHFTFNALSLFLFRAMSADLTEQDLNAATELNAEFLSVCTFLFIISLALMPLIIKIISTLKKDCEINITKDEPEPSFKRLDTPDFEYDIGDNPLSISFFIILLSYFFLTILPFLKTQHFWQ